MSVEIKTFITGPLETNTYLVSSAGQCWIVDPAGGSDDIADFIRTSQLQAKAILLTHGHGDHIAAVADLLVAFEGLQLICPADDAFMLTNPIANMSAQFGMAINAPQPDELIRPGQTLKLAEAGWDVLDTSGHTPGGLSYYCAEAAAVIVGDALFAGSVGRTDIPGASTAKLILNVRENLLSLPDETCVLPGHGPQTKIGIEKQTNPFLTNQTGAL